MVVVLVVLLVAAVGAVAALVLGRGRGVSVGMPAPVSSAGGILLPEGHEVTSDALSEVRFDRALRGYRMDQVDAVLDRLQADLADREARLQEFAAAAGGSFPVVTFDDDDLGFDPFQPPEDS